MFNLAIMEIANFHASILFYAPVRFFFTVACCDITFNEDKFLKLI